MRIAQFAQSFQEVYLMNAKQKLHQAHLAEWANRFSEQKASGLTVRQWCEQNNISFHRYNYWKHQLKEQVVDHMLPEIVQLSVPASIPSTDISSSRNRLAHRSTTIRANRANCANHSNANVRLCVDGVALELEPSVSEDFLRTLIRAVHYA